MKITMRRKNLYVALAFSPLLLLSGCNPLNWFKSNSKEKTSKKIGRRGRRKVTGGYDTGGEWVVKLGEKIIVSSNRLQKEFDTLLEEKPQLKAMRALMPNLEKDFARGLGHQEIISQFIKDKKIDERADFIAKKERTLRAVEQMLNTEFFAKSFESVSLDEKELKKFYEENKDSMQGIMISQGGVNAVGVSFDKKSDAQEFLKKAQAAGRDRDLQKLAKANGIEDKAQDFKLVSGRSFGVDPVLKTKILALKKFPTLEILAVGDKSFWVVSASSKEKTKYRSFEEVKDGIKQVAEQTELSKKLQKELDVLTKTYGLEVNEAYFAKRETPAPTVHAESKEAEELVEALFTQAAQQAVEEETKPA